MRRHWQREPLLLRGAFPAFADPLSPREVLRLACDADATARLVQRRGRKWTLEHGPFAPSRWRTLPKRDWTVLVQDTNHVSAKADALLARFDFIAHSRIDDVMVSYAVPGGGVGPHVDSYDVFLLQGHGRRRWQISRQRDLDCVPGLPLRVLERFRPEEEWVLEAGDMLYLPPGVAHHGVAETECLTWSIGLRAPSDTEIARGLLDFLHDDVDLAGHYGDAGARPTRRPGEIPEDFVAHVARVARQVRWSAPQLRELAGRLLSEPRPQVFFSPPARPLAAAAFVASARRHGIALDRRTRLLSSRGHFFINGEAVEAPASARAALRRLSDARRLEPGDRAAATFWPLAHAWYRQGFLDISLEAP